MAIATKVSPTLRAGLMLAALLVPQAAWGAPAEVLTGHPLAGRIWSAAQDAFVSRADLIEAAAAADAVLLGEKHDNARHHRLQAAILADLAAGPRMPALVWEMIEPAADPVLSRAGVIGASGLGAALAWQESGWPAWSDYQPVAEVAVRHGLPMRGAALPRETVRALAGDAEGAAVARPLGAEDYEDLLDQLEASHCGAVPRSSLEGMAAAQLARDAAIAGAVEELIAGGFLAVGIIGGGHARRDRGVPWHLPARDVLSVAFLEVVRGDTRPQDYFDEGAFDFVWFTPRVDEDDPCARFDRAPAPRAGPGEKR